MQQLMSPQGVQNVIMQRAERLPPSVQQTERHTKATDSENTSATSSAVRVAQVIATTHTCERTRTWRGRAHSAPRPSYKGRQRGRAHGRRRMR